jgi:uncharacterized protein YktA (UPF0223 family)
MDEAIGQGGDTSGLAPRIAALEQALDDLTGTEDTTQIIDTFNEVIDFLASVNNNETLLGKLQQLQNQINSKANDNAVVKDINDSNGNTLPKSNGIVTLPPAGSTISPATAAPSMDGTAAVGSSAKYAREDHVHTHDTSKLSKSDVSVETQGDGTVDIIVGNDKYTININHVHPQYLKYELLADEEAYTELTTKDSSTLYLIPEA